MSNNKDPSSGDNFIELDKDQFKKKTNIKRNLIFLTFCALLLFIIFYFKDFYSVENFFPLKTNNLQQDNKIAELELESKSSNINNDLVDLLDLKINKLSKEIVDNNFKISELNSKILKLRQKNEILEKKQKTNIKFINAEKSLILNSLLHIKNKFKLRKKFNEELRLLSLRIEDKPEIKMLLIDLQDIEVMKLTTTERLLDTLNRKINFYQEDLTGFIESNLNKASLENYNIFDSKENFIKYVKDLINSTYKITKVEENSESKINLFLNESNLIASLKMAKEYLIFGNLNKSIETLNKSIFDDYEINNWIQEAKNLEIFISKLNLLESKLIDYIGENID